MTTYKPVLAKRGSAYAIRKIRTYRNGDMDRAIGKTHGFRIFRLGLDICAVCQKPRSEHG
jgi:hypothetical protein